MLTERGQNIIWVMNDPSPGHIAIEILYVYVYLFLTSGLPWRVPPWRPTAHHRLPLRALHARVRGGGGSGHRQGEEAAEEIERRRHRHRKLLQSRRTLRELVHQVSLMLILKLQGKSILIITKNI